MSAPAAGGAWDFLPPRCRAVVGRLGFREPTPVQKACLPDALSGKSLRAVAPTGTGKTLAYLLPLWNSLPADRRNLVLVPTRELAYQVSQMLQALDPRARDGLALCVGGHDRETQWRGLRRGWHTVVATPGRLLDALREMPRLLEKTALLVLDEFDRLMGLGFEEQITQILKSLPHRRQTLLFSATGEEAGGKLSLGALSPYDIAGGKSAPLEECFYFFKSNRKKNDLLLEALGRNGGQAIVFVANREKANHLNGLLRLRGFSAQALHGDRLQRERARIYQGFKEASVRVLVATDLAARGLDMPEVDLIVNYDLPRTFKDYVHRSGRAARRQKPGLCLSFSGPDDYLALRNLEKGFGRLLPAHPDFSEREAWLLRAKAAHEAKVRQEHKAEFIRREQGLESA